MVYSSNIEFYNMLISPLWTNTLYLHKIQYKDATPWPSTVQTTIPATTGKLFSAYIVQCSW